MGNRAFADLDLIDALQILLVIVAQERRAMSAPAAANALGKTPDDYMQTRREATALGLALANRLRAARAA